MDELKKMEKSSDISKDELRNAEQEVQDVINKYTKEVDSITKSKEDELMEI